MAPEVKRNLEAASVSFESFVWAPSGRALYFEGASFETSFPGTERGVRNLWKVTVDPDTLRWIAGPERLTISPGQQTDLALSRDGKRLAVAAREESTRIWSFPFDAATGRVVGQGQPVTAAGKDAAYPDLTPDGRKLVFVASRAGREELWEKSLVDGGKTLLAAEYEFNFPRWSRDGKRLACRLRRLDDPESRIILMPAGGGREEPLTSPAFLGGPHSLAETPFDWSANGKWILGSSRRPNPRVGTLIWLLPLSGAPHAEGEGRVVTSDPDYNLWQARFSPDERWICFNAVNATRVVTSTIYVVGASGGDWIRITDEKYWADKPRWSPDGKTIYFLSSRGGFLNVWGKRFNSIRGEPGKDPFQVTRFGSPGRMVTDRIVGADIALSADRLVLPMKEVSGNIWMLDNVDQ